MTSGILLTLMLITLCLTLLSGFPVAFVLSGVALIFAMIGDMLGLFNIHDLYALPSRIYGIMTNSLLLAVPLFVFMGVLFEKAKIAEELLETMAELFGSIRSGLGISVIIVGALLGASTGIVGATVVTMGLISLPVMLNAKYSHTISTGIICASGTLGQIIPPSIVLILLGDQISAAYQTSQMEIGNLAPEPVSIADLFAGAIIPSIVLVGLYIIWLVIYSFISPESVQKAEIKHKDDHIFIRTFKVLLPPLLLIMAVLGSILGGFATATESAATGAIGAMVITFAHKRLTIENLRLVCQETAKITSMVFTILIGATFFTLVFRGFGGDDIIHDILKELPGGLFGAVLVSMIVMFVLGFFLDFIEIIFVVVPIVAPILLMMGANPIWLSIMIAVNLQTSFLTPPFGFALFYLRGVAPKEVKTMSIYKGVTPFVIIQLLMLVILSLIPSMTTWLPKQLYDTDHTISEIVDTDDGKFISNDGADF